MFQNFLKNILLIEAMLLDILVVLFGHLEAKENDK